jgi:integrase
MAAVTPQISCLCGLREYELCSLKVDDLGDGLWLHVPEGFGCEERMVSFAEFIWVRVWVNDWLDSAEIRDGYIFWGFYRSEGKPTARKVRPKPLSPRTFEKILARYPLKTEKGIKYTVRPMDLRKAYARLLYEARIELPEIQLRLGLRDANAVLDYIGGQEADLGVPWDRYALGYFDEELLKAFEVKRMTGDDRSRKGP